MRTKRRKIGDMGETVTCQFLVKQGFSILERNYLKPWGEIDIVAIKGGTIHFVEVKTVVADSLDDVIRETDMHRPEENVHEAKLRRLSKTIQTYLVHKGIEMDWQCDIATVLLEEGLKRAKVRILPNIVL